MGTYTADSTASLAGNRLGAPSVLFFTLSAVAPLTVCAGVITTAYAVTGLSDIPAAFVVLTLVLALFAVGYVAMARRIVNAGAFYSFVAHGLGRSAGVGAAFVAVVAYNALQVGLYGAFGATLSDYLGAHFDLKVAWWICALAAWCVTALCGTLAVDLNSKVLAFLVTLEIVVIIILTISGIMNPASGGISFATLSPGNLFVSSAGAALTIGVLAFTGFEQSAIFSEEAREPRRTVNIATYTSIVAIGIVYGGASWAMAVAYGDGQVIDVAKKNGPAAFFDMGGSAISSAAQVLFITSLFAAMLSFHNAVSRYMFALGRERVLPAAMGRTNLRSAAPQTASLTQSLIGLVVILGFAAAHLDPMVQLFFWIGTTGGFGILILLCATSAAVIGYFFKNAGDESVWRAVIAPGIALILLTYLAWQAVVDYATLLGVAADAAIAWILPASYLFVAVAGIVWGLVLRSLRPTVFASIGLGPNADIGDRR